jgi:hypothetical protein
LTGFLERYLPRFYRIEQRATATLVIRGHLSGLERKTSVSMDPNPYAVTEPELLRSLKLS